MLPPSVAPLYASLVLAVSLVFKGPYRRRQPRRQTNRRVTSQLGAASASGDTGDQHYHKEASLQIDLHTQAAGPAVDLVTN